MTSQPPAAGPGQPPAAQPPATCRRPGCGNALPPPGRGRARVFCSDDCARRYHNDARLPAPASPADQTGGTGTGGDPLAALEALARQGAVLIRAARDQAASLDPARVRAQVAAAEAARAAAAAAEAAAAQAAGDADAAEAEAARLRRDTDAKIAAGTAAARQDAARCARERDDALAAARQARHDAGTETTRARQAETDARAETASVRDDAARERDTLREQYQAQLAAASALTAAERARAERAASPANPGPAARARTRVGNGPEHLTTIQADQMAATGQIRWPSAGRTHDRHWAVPDVP
jgi:hypothetical protein